MRISQLARKFDLSVQELSAFLKTLEPELKSVHPNAKLDQNSIDQVIKHFDLVQEDLEGDSNEESADEIAPEITPSENIIEEEENDHDEVSFEEELMGADAGATDQLIKPEFEESRVEEIQSHEEENLESSAVPSEDEVILSDELLAMIDSEDAPADVDKIKLIKAPKKKLSGLTVIDKIEIPEDPRKAKEAEETKVSRFTPEEKAERARKREEYKEKRRLEAKEKKEAYEARKAKRIQDQEAKRLKAIKQKHYQQQLHKTAPNQSARRKEKKAVESSMQTQVEPPAKKPRTLIGKFWRWLNT